MEYLTRGLGRGLVISGLFVLGSGCHLEVHEDLEECLDEYGDCLDDLPPHKHHVCERIKDACIDACEAERGYPGGDWGTTSGAEDDGWGDDETAGDGTPKPTTTTSTSGTTGVRTSGGEDGEGGDDGAVVDGSGDAGVDGGGESSSGGIEPNPACFELHATCVERAGTLVEIQACEDLLVQCLDAAPCDDGCEVVCPDPELSACLDGYAACAAQSATKDDVTMCAVSFDDCAAGLSDDACVPPYDPEVLDPCLEQHALCVECIEGPEDLVLCRDVFDTCVNASEH